MLDRIQLEDFRNHPATALDGAGRFNLLVGDNGAGKTNVLEAISLLAPGRGLRRAALGDMTRAGDPGGRASGFAISARLGDVVLGTAMRAGQPGRRIVHINGAESSATKFAEWLGLAWLTPAMDRLFVEGASGRRRFLDRLVLALEPGHASLAARYETALRERNRLLADASPPDPAWLDGLEAQLAEAGASLGASRAACVARLGEALADTPEQPFSQPALTYRAETPPDPAELAAAFAAGRRRDRAAGRTLNGPHRDDLEVTFAAKGRPAAECSTGEQKAMLIAIILAHAALSDPARPRVLLLDEVAAHLDAARRAALFERLRVLPGQYWLTGTELAPFEGIAGEAAVWRVSEGIANRIG